MQICFRNISSTQLNVRSVLDELNMTVFFQYSSFFSNWCHLLSFLKNHKIMQTVTNFCIIHNFFHHRHNDKNLSKGDRKQISLQNQYWMPQFFKFIMQKPFASYWHFLKISYTHIFATILFCSKSKKKLKVIEQKKIINWFLLQYSETGFFPSKTHF